MKKYILFAIIILIMITSAGCTITIPAPTVASSQQSVNEPQTNHDNTQEQNSNNTTQQQNSSQSTQATPTPEPTQQFVNESGNQATAVPNYVNHSDIMGMWYLVLWDDADTVNEYIFYEITSAMMNVLPYGSAPSGRDYNYTYSNGVMDFGNGAYDVILDQGVLVLRAKSTGKMIVFQPVTEQDIQLILPSSNSSSSSGDVQIVNGSLPSGNFEVISPSSPSGRTGYPHNQGEIVDRYTGAEQINSQLTGRTWRTYGYAWDDGSIVHDFMAYSEFQFFNDYTFTLNHSFGTSDGLYEIADTALILYYSDGSQDFYGEVFIEVNQNSGYAYLFISDEDEGYEGCYKIYEGY